jgi:hypothetical protein
VKTLALLLLTTLSPVSFALDAPTNLTASVASGAVTLTWSAVPGAQGYNIYQAASPAALPTLNTVTPTVNGSQLHPGAMNSYSFAPGLCTGSCYYSMSAWSCATGCVVSALSSPVSVNTNASPTYAVIFTCAGASAVPTVSASGSTYTVNMACQSMALNLTPPASP